MTNNDTNRRLAGREIVADLGLILDGVMAGLFDGIPAEKWQPHWSGYIKAITAAHSIALAQHAQNAEQHAETLAQIEGMAHASRGELADHRAVARIEMVGHGVRIEREKRDRQRASLARLQGAIAALRQAPVS